MALPYPDRSVSLLLISAQPSDLSSLTTILTGSKWKLKVRRTCDGVVAMVRQNRLPVVICDDESTGGRWQSLLDELAAVPTPPALIVSSRLADERLWSKVLNLGGYDVLPTPFDRSEVLRVCFQAWQFWERHFDRMPLSATG